MLQVVFADIVLLNKTDLVEEAYLEEVESRIRGINKTVGSRSLQCCRSEGGV